MRRTCPHCSNRSIQIKEILFRDCRCPECHSVVGIRRAFAAFFSIVIFVATTFVVLVELGFYGALIWFSVPVGALSYIKARFSPLEVKAVPHNLGRPSGA